MSCIVTIYLNITYESVACNASKGVVGLAGYCARDDVVQRRDVTSFWDDCDVMPVLHLPEIARKESLIITSALRGRLTSLHVDSWTAGNVRQTGRLRSVLWHAHNMSQRTLPAFMSQVWHRPHVRAFIALLLSYSQFTAPDPTRQNWSVASLRVGELWTRY